MNRVSLCLHDLKSRSMLCNDVGVRLMVSVVELCLDFGVLFVFHGAERFHVHIVVTGADVQAALPRGHTKDCRV